MNRLMKKNNVRISIVVPAYNEELGLAACLNAIAQQTITPYEVIVVDNNSSDKTAEIARQFPFVRLISESTQGVVYARTTGFNAASGDIIARIDADTLLPIDWFARLIDIFNDSTVAAVSGQPHYYDFPMSAIADSIDRSCRRRLYKTMKVLYLYGSNMAVRRSAWLQIRQNLCMQGNMHEDFDLAIHLQEKGFKVIYDENLVANIGSRRIDTGLISFVRYTLVSPHTYRLHGMSCGREMYRVVAICWLCYFPGRLMYRSFDQTAKRFSWKQFRTPTAGRIDPTKNVYDMLR